MSNDDPGAEPAPGWTRGPGRDLDELTRLVRELPAYRPRTAWDTRVRWASALALHLGLWGWTLVRYGETADVWYVLGTMGFAGGATFVWWHRPWRQP